MPVNHVAIVGSAAQLWYAACAEGHTVKRNASRIAVVMSAAASSGAIKYRTSGKSLACSRRHQSHEALQQ